ncbi:tRNA (adenosine(37)-N6)-threonylcarbamoyltransferase complex dimerization subunit type 1 TsaB [Sedimentitalea sp. JM2-8]|uniref:tRNA (Adenosine(37)-N6)-threonylcarbamoyltransferase complex dimerization subunit type 1 TsaB n=1 Tax=Sedimentitalea xiamensis TaxID=3050037 RepID=A0ABT7FE63_9RHOB|nr:tRNA (adenosine(37)-N6)-threonylcarbamoyltransferase complex dimerization subunit type 1 TsaB [Sedimentitalea xiamensis]MDK3073416.1 tRNA (adenosine(37)-N6)-threonylcarbamoyltransferase complex dimerization subunit type 1 TsaB [Sedimentitalea xiamensis]
MAHTPLILGFDTSAAHCAAALLSGDRVVAERAEPMARGQAERLIPLLEEILAEGHAEWGDLTAIGVGIGPGNFTGIRIAVSAARGLALGLRIPAVGVTGCEARARLAPGEARAIPAPRDQIYLCDRTDPRALPRLMSRPEAEALAGGPVQAEPCPVGLAGAIARIAAERWAETTEPPAPIYTRAAAAAPSRDAPPVLLD